MQAGGYAAQPGEGGGVDIGGGFGALHPAKQHGVAGYAIGAGKGADAPAIKTGPGLGHVQPGFVQCIEPGQFAANFSGGMIAGPVQAQHMARAGWRIDAKDDVF